MKAQVKAWWVGNVGSSHENQHADHAFLIDEYYPDQIGDDEIEDAGECLVECSYNDGEPIRKVNHVAVSVDGGAPYIVKITAKIGESLESEIVKRDATEADTQEVW